MLLFPTWPSVVVIVHLVTFHHLAERCCHRALCYLPPFGPALLAECIDFDRNAARVASPLFKICSVFTQIEMKLDGTLFRLSGIERARRPSYRRICRPLCQTWTLQHELPEWSMFEDRRAGVLRSLRQVIPIGGTVSDERERSLNVVVYKGNGTVMEHIGQTRADSIDDDG